MRPLLAIAVAALLLQPPAAYAVPVHRAPAPTCHGKPATVVGGTGTNEADVIVTNGATDVMGGAGSDLICVTPAPGSDPRDVSVEGGPGNDLVDTTHAGITGDRVGVFTDLGPGRDVLVGGPGMDVVATHPDGDHDVIRTGGGPDSVDVNEDSGDGLTRAEHDTYDLGSGADSVHEYTDRSPDGSIDGGPGRDTLTLSLGDVDAPHRAWVVDAARGQVSRAGHVISRIRGMEDFDQEDFYAASFHFRGSRRAEQETVEPVDNDFDVDHGLSVDLGGGNDTVVSQGPSAFTARGGPGRDLLVLQVDATYLTATMRADLRSGHVVSQQRGGRPVRMRARGFEDAAADDFLQATLIGTDGPNRLSTDETCRTRLEGLGGPDTLVVEPSRYYYPQEEDCHGATLLGGRGDDRLRGATYDDTLVGGPGRDLANGAAGTDTCTAERRLSCER